MLLPFSIRVAECYLLGKELFIRLTVRVFSGRWSNFVSVLLSLLILRVGCEM